jgi:hypothetical protein
MRRTITAAKATGRRLLTGVVVFAGLLAQSLQANSSDQVRVEVPHLAPGTTLVAPLTVRWFAGHRFRIDALLNAATTGNFFYDTMLRLYLGSTMTLSGQVPLEWLRGRRPVRGYQQTVLTLKNGIVRMDLPFVVDPRQSRHHLESHFSITLTQFGVINPSGGSPGSAVVYLKVGLPATVNSSRAS